MELSLFLTENAKKHFSKLAGKENAISLSMKTTGCTGYAYVLKTVPKTDNEIYVFQDIPFVIEDQFKNAFNNLVIDYKKEGINSKVTYDNPNTAAVCGCGESFSLKEEV